MTPFSGNGYKKRSINEDARAMMEIARNGSENGVFQKDISQRQDISNKYLDHIIHGLKVAELISKKGKTKKTTGKTKKTKKSTGKENKKKK